MKRGQRELLIQRAVVAAAITAVGLAAAWVVVKLVAWDPATAGILLGSLAFLILYFGCHPKSNPQP